MKAVEERTQSVDPLREMAQRDLRNQAEPEESAMLRSDENLEEWRLILVDIMKDIDAQFSERRARFQEFQNACWRGGEAAKADFFEGKGQFLAWEAGAKRVKRSCEKRIAEANALLARRRQARRGEAAPGLPRDYADLAAHALKMQNERQAYRSALVDVQKQLLEYDAAFTEEFKPLRDVVLGKVLRVLYPEPAARQSLRGPETTGGIPMAETKSTLEAWADARG